jgi:predicted AlkP superfamily phosphohydrolase/phosphomutase
MLVGFPGMEASLLDRWTADGTMPTFADAIRKGRSLVPKNRQAHIPDIVWPEIYTGRLGVPRGLYRFPEQLFAGDTAPRQVRLDDFDLTSVWDHASAAGRTVAALDIPYSQSSPEINGIHLRSWGTHDKPYGPATEPRPELLAELVARFGKYPREHVHAEHTRCDDHDDTTASYRSLRADMLAGADAKARLFRHILDEREWDLFLCSFEEAHCAGHEFWHHSDPGSPWHDPAAPEDVKSTLRDVYARLDTRLGDMLDGAGDDAVVAIVLSHGMQRIGGGWQLLGEVLVRLGYSSGNKSVGKLRGALPEPVKSLMRGALRGRARSGLQRVAGSLPAPLESPETRAVALLNSPCGAIRFNVKGRDPFGAIEPGRELDEACDELEHELSQLVDTRTGQPALTRITRATEFYGEQVHPNTPDLLLLFNPAGAPIESVSSDRVGTISRPVRSPALPRSGDHSENSRLIFVGPGVEPAPPHSAGDILDVTPTLLDLLDVPLPDLLDGTPLDLRAPASSASALAEPAS